MDADEDALDTVLPPDGQYAGESLLFAMYNVSGPHVNVGDASPRHGRLPVRGQSMLACVCVLVS